MTTGSRLQRYLVPGCAIACGLILGIEIAPTIAAHVGHDQAWDLYAANAVMHGVKLNGPRLLEVNPPFLVWFFSLPALLARLLHISLSAGFRTFLIASTVALIAWSASLYRRVCRASVLGTWLFVLCSIYVATGPIGLDDRGQREYFTALFLLPYVLWAASRSQSIAIPPTETLAVAFFAVVGICLKPQHVLDVIVVELLVLIRLRKVRQWFQPALIALIAGPVIYLLAVRIFSPSYLQEITPLLRDTYWGFDKPWSTVAHAVSKQATVFAIGIILYVGLRRRLRVEPMVACLLAATTGALLAYAQQHKGWSYQLLALQIFSYLAVAIICSDVAEQMWLKWGVTSRSAEAKPLRTSIGVGLAVLAFVIALSIRLRQQRPVPYFEVQKTELAAIYSEYPAGTAVGLAGVSSPGSGPKCSSRTRSGLHVTCTSGSCPRSFAARIRSIRENAIIFAGEDRRTLSLLRRTTAEDLAYWSPPVVVIDPCGDPQHLRGTEAHRLFRPARLVRTGSTVSRPVVALSLSKDGRQYAGLYPRPVACALYRSSLRKFRAG